MPVRLALAVALLAGPVAVAQNQIDDPPRPLDDKPLTRDELNRRKADQLLREARARFGVAIISQRQERLIEAVGTFEKAAKLDPESLEIRRALIPLYAVIGRDAEARRLAGEVLDRDPFDPETAFQYARLLRGARPTPSPSSRRPPAARTPGSAPSGCCSSCRTWSTCSKSKVTSPGRPRPRKGSSKQSRSAVSSSCTATGSPARTSRPAWPAPTRAWAVRA
jgi:tetratricopeptide (TPR) repeat protein